MRAAAIQVANGVTFELQSVDDQRGRRLRFGWCRWNRLFPVPGGFDVFGLGIAQDEHESCAVGRPLEIINALDGVGQANGFTATAASRKCGCSTAVAVKPVA